MAGALARELGDEVSASERRRGPVMRGRSALRLVAFFGAIMLVASGCHRMTGGGWIESAVPGKKAHFGFQVRCIETENEDGTTTAAFHVGQLQYVDAAAGVRLHGDAEVNAVVTGPDVTCEDPGVPFDGSFEILGTYRPQPRGATGDFLVVITDAGEPGRNDDTFSIELTGGTYDGYTNSGTLGGGNIQITEE
jgi:hypothetical protein